MNLPQIKSASGTLSEAKAKSPSPENEYPLWRGLDVSGSMVPPEIDEKSEIAQIFFTELYKRTQAKKQA